MRTHLLHITAIRAACEHGRVLREQVGTLTGDASGEHDLAVLDPTAAARLATEVATATAGAPELAGTEPGREPPEVPTLLANVISEDEHALVARSELAGRIGLEVTAFGEALRAAGVPSAGKRRMPGHDNPVSMADLDMIRSVIHGKLRPERGRHSCADPA